MAGMQVAATTFPYLYSMTGLEAMKHLKGMAYDAFEMLIFPPHCWPHELNASQRKEYRSWLDGEGCRITSFCYPLLDNNPNGVDPLMRRYTLDRYLEAIDLAAEWKCPYVVCIPGPVNSLINPPHQWMLEWFVEGMKELTAHAQGAGIEMLIENVPFAFLPTAADVKAAAEAIGPRVGINLDICNSAYIKEDVPGAIKLLGPLIKNVHISDSGYGEFKHDRLGTGIVEVGPAAQALQEIGYDGLTVLEMISDANDPANDPDEDFRVSHDILARHGWQSRG